MIPIIALIGRRNVGKSTLFNRLTYTCDALVSSDSSGLTRDRRYGVFKWKGYQVVITDTAGIGILNYEIDTLMFNQSKYAIVEADLILFIVDGKTGIIPFDYEIVKYLYKFQKSVFVIVNKIDNFQLRHKKLEFYALGFKKVIPISAAHGCGIDILSEEIFSSLCYRKLLLNSDISNESCSSNFFLKSPSYLLSSDSCENLIVLSVIGSPNVGKSTFINYLLGKNRTIVCDSPGTTRDSICVSMIYNGYKFILIDTAGIRRKNLVSSLTEKLSINQTLKIIKNVTVVLLLIAADRGISNYDLSLLNNILSSGKSLVIGINKWDLLSVDMKKKFREMCNIHMGFVRFIKISFISSLCGYGISDILNSIIEAHHSVFNSTISTSLLINIMNLAVAKYHPPNLFGKQIKLKYAHIGGYGPLRIVIHGNRVTSLPDNYKRYLVNCFSSSLQISHVSIFLHFKESK